MDCRPKRVAIVGAGAAGMAAAWSMSRYPDKFKVTVIEAGAACGGVACTLDHEGKRVNFGVQVNYRPLFYTLHSACCTP